MLTVNLKTSPELRRLILAADPTYKKHSAFLHARDSVALSGTYWDGGSRSTYTAVDMETGRNQGAPQFSPPQFGGPRAAPVVSIPEGVCIVETGIFCGKTATASITVNPANMAKLIPA